MSENVSFDVAGLPATFATAREKLWKSVLAVNIPGPSMSGRELGLTARFVLPTLAPAGHPLDIDNLCEPLFAILVNRMGWFRRARPNMRWWRASKEEGLKHGCRLAVSADPTPPPDNRPVLLAGTYSGSFPRSAKAPEVADWSRCLLGSTGPFPPDVALACHLGFGATRVNIGDVATGVVKSFIDCLYPILGGSPSSPADHRIDKLTVAKAVSGVADDAVVLELRPLDRVVPPSPPRRPRSSTPTAIREKPHVTDDTQRPRPREVVSNPCRPGSAKYIVCEAALAATPLDQVRRELDAVKPGSSRNLSDYISDLRSENGLDVGHDGRTMWCRGRIAKR